MLQVYFCFLFYKAFFQSRLYIRTYGWILFKSEKFSYLTIDPLFSNPSWIQNPFNLFPLKRTGSIMTQLKWPKNGTLIVPIRVNLLPDNLLLNSKFIIKLFWCFEASKSFWIKSNNKNTNFGSQSIGVTTSFVFNLHFEHFKLFSSQFLL